MLKFVLESKSDIILDGQVLHVQDVIHQHYDVVATFGRKVVFVQMPAGTQSIQFYLSLISSNAVPLFISHDINYEAFVLLIKQFKPNFIVTRLRQFKDTPKFRHLGNWLDSNIYFYEDSNEVDLDKSVCLLASTSGSTGNPKLIPQTYANLISNTQQISYALALNSAHRALASLPLSYTFGMSVVNCQLYNNATIVPCEQNIMHRSALQLIYEHEIDIIAGIPTTYEMLLAGRFFSSKYARSVKKYLQAGGALLDGTRRKLHEALTKSDVEFYTMYGQAEATTRISISSPRDFVLKSSSVGKPLKGITLSFGEVIECDQAGNEIAEIYCTGENVCPDYVVNVGELSKVNKRERSILSTGDLGYIDAEGNLHITGRLKRFAKIRGISINLVDVENKLFSELGMYYPCVEFENKILLFTDTAKASNLPRELVDKIMQAYKIQDYDVCIIDEIPYLSNGKVNFKRLTDVAGTKNAENTFQ